MSVAIVIADEITAAGFRLAGLETRVPDDTDVLAEFDAACRNGALIFITAELARRLPPSRLAAALEAEAPLVALIPDIDERSIVPDLAIELQRALGIGA